MQKHTPEKYQENERKEGAIQTLSVVIPVYNGSETIISLVTSLIELFATQKYTLEIILVNDGSPDNSHEKALELVSSYPDLVKYIHLARNFGEHNAVMCGLNYSTGDCAAIIDDDFQTPPSEIIHLVKKLEEGYDVVYSYYEKKQHSWFRNLGSDFNDWVATRLLRKPRDLYLSSFKVLRADLIRTIVQYRGPYPYIDGIILRSTQKIGKQLTRHEARQTGESNYTLKKLIHLWINMFTGYSVLPLRIASYAGLGMSLFSVILIVFFVVSRLTGGIFLKQAIPAGWASLIIVVTLFSGVQLCVLGIMGEYLGRLFLTVNNSPQYVISDIFGKGERKKEHARTTFSR